MNSLQTLVQSIVTDLIASRFEADVKAAELADAYKDHAILRELPVPTLNISNVSVELRFAFDDSPIEGVSGPSDQQIKVIKESATSMRAVISTLDSVTEKITVPRQKTALSNKLRTGVIKAATTTINDSPDTRKAAITTEIEKILRNNGVNLKGADRRKLLAELDDFESALSTAPKAPSKVPGIIVGAEKLAGMNADAVSVVRFDVDLSSARWVEVDDGTGSVRSVLVDR